MKESEKVKHFFDRYVAGFDSLYSDRKRRNLLNRILRASFYRRFQLAVEDAKRLKPGFSVLDVGTGTARYPSLLAPQASFLVGIDLSETMIESAQARAEAEGYGDRLKLFTGDFLKQDFNQNFDLVVALGYFDYIMEPSPHLHKMFKLSREMVLASFPKRWHILTPQRKLRYWLSRCPLRFYTANEIKKYVGTLNLKNIQLIDLGREYYLRFFADKR